MKNKFYPLRLCIIVFLFFSCKKDIGTEITKSDAVSSPDYSEAKGDGIITFQTGILPPVTQQTFIPNESNSIAEFQIATSQHIFIYQLFFSATYPAIRSINIDQIGIGGNAGGIITYNGSGPYINAGKGLSLLAKLSYNNVDSGSSGTTATLSLAHIVYRTDDEVYHDFYPDAAGKAETMCLVNNIPDIQFQDPKGDSLKNGYKEIAALKLTGDSSYAINALPLNLWTQFSAIIPKTKLILKHKDKMIPAESDSIQLEPYASAQTVIRFNGGFQHAAGGKEIIKIYAPVSGFYPLIVTTLSPLTSFVWTEALGAKIPGAKNNKFFKEQTGRSIFFSNPVEGLYLNTARH